MNKLNKDNAVTILNNLKENIKMYAYFNKQETICRNLDKVSEGIINGFDKKS